MVGKYLRDHNRIYSLHSQIVKCKEVKILTDYDVKIQMLQKQKVEAFKSVGSQSFNLRQLLKLNNYITKYVFLHR